MLQFLTIIIMAALVVIDRILKSLVTAHLKPIGNFVLINKVLQLNYVENTGAAFGSFKNNTFVLIIFTSILLIAALYILFFRKPKSKLLYVSLVMLISGGAGNLIDRIFYGYVVDYIDVLFVKFAVFNFADMLVTVGAFILAFYLVADIINDNKKAKLSKSGEKHNE